MFLHIQVAAMWVIDRERPMLDELVNLLHDRQSLPAVTTAVYAEIVSEHMDSLGFRCKSLARQLTVRQRHLSSAAHHPVWASNCCAITSRPCNRCV